MTKKYVQVKINIPTSYRSVIEYCDKLSTQRILSARIIRLLSDDLNKRKKEEKGTLREVVIEFITKL